MNSRVFLVLTVHKVAAAAKLAITARAGEKANADPLADLPTANAGSHRVNAPDDLVAGNTRISDAREPSLDCQGVGVANTARLDAERALGRGRDPEAAASLQRTLLVSVPQWLCRSHSFSLLAVRRAGAEAIQLQNEQSPGAGDA